MIDRELGLLVDQAFLGSGRSQREAWLAAGEAGARWICATEEAVGSTPERQLELRETAAAAGVPVALTTCHAFGLNDPRDVVRDFNLERAKQHVDLTRNLGADHLKVLLGEWIWRTLWPDGLQWQTLVASVRELASYAARRGVEVSVELEPLDTSLINDVSSLDALLTDVGSASLLANIDTSHMVVRGDPAAGIIRLAGRISTVDFSDSNGRYHEHLPPGRGTADLASFVRELTRACSAAPLIAVEVGPFGDPENAYDKVRRSIAATELLFASAPEGATI